MAEPSWDLVVERACAQLKRMLTDYKKEIERGREHVDQGKPYKIDSKIILVVEDDGGTIVDSEISFELAKKVQDHIKSKVGGKQLDLPLGDPLAGKE